MIVRRAELERAFNTFSDSEGIFIPSMYLDCRLLTDFHEISRVCVFEPVERSRESNGRKWYEDGDKPIAIT